MTRLINTLSIAPLLIACALQAQQSPNPQPAQPLPCVTTSTALNPSGNNPTIKVPNKLRQVLNKKLQKVEDQTGIPISEVGTEIAQASASKPTPCPPLAVPPKTSQTVVAPVLKLPPDITATLHCNPMTPSANSRPTTLTLPDPHEFATPKPTDFLVDNVVPDLAAHAPCFQVKVDPKTGRSFLSQ